MEAQLYVNKPHFLWRKNEIIQSYCCIKKYIWDLLDFHLPKYKFRVWQPSVHSTLHFECYSFMESSIYRKFNIYFKTNHIQITKREYVITLTMKIMQYKLFITITNECAIYIIFAAASFIMRCYYLERINKTKNL